MTSGTHAQDHIQGSLRMSLDSGPHAAGRFRRGRAGLRREARGASRSAARNAGGRGQERWMVGSNTSYGTDWIIPIGRESIGIPRRRTRSYCSSKKTTLLSTTCPQRGGGRRSRGAPRNHPPTTYTPFFDKSVWVVRERKSINLFSSLVCSVILRNTLTN